MFRELIEQAIEGAEMLDCPPEEFRTGLACMFHEIKERLNMEGIDPLDPKVLEAVNQMDGDE